jgi:hypothetical protein
VHAALNVLSNGEFGERRFDPRAMALRPIGWNLTGYWMLDSGLKSIEHQTPSIALNNLKMDAKSCFIKRGNGVLNPFLGGEP